MAGNRKSQQQLTLSKGARLTGTEMIDKAHSY
jgi:hypothetical protein